MTVLKNIRWKAAIGAGILLTATWGSQASAELVYEESAIQPAASATPSRAEERGSLRQVVNASEKAQSTLQAQAPQTVPILDSTEVQNLSRSELLRRERVRAEIKNEDLLQERLEELRLRDEQRRSGQVMGASSNNNSSGNISADAQSGPSVVVTGYVPAAPLPLQEETVVVPSTERPGQGSRPVVVPAMSSVGLTEQDRHVYSTSSVASSMTFSDNPEVTHLSVQPRFGLAQMSGNSYYDVRPRFSSGVSLGVVSTENISFELGYTYSEFGVAVNSYNPYAQYAVQYQVSQTVETVAMKQNLVDVGMKLHLLGADAKIRPFVGGGAGYAFSFVNYDQRVLDQMAGANPYWRSYLGQDYELKSFLGFLSTGVDIRVSRNVVLGVVGKYYNVFSSRESSALNNAALWGGYPAYGPAPDADKQYIGGTLARLNFYSVMGSVTFVF